MHIKRIKLAADVHLDEIAGITPGFTGADLANLVNEAAIVATRHGGSEVTTPDFTAAVERIVAGAERKGRLLLPHERRVVPPKISLRFPSQRSISHQKRQRGAHKTATREVLHIARAGASVGVSRYRVAQAHWVAA